MDFDCDPSLTQEEPQPTSASKLSNAKRSGEWNGERIG